MAGYAAQHHHCRIRSSSAYIHHHVAHRIAHRQSGAYGGGKGLVQHYHIPCARVLCSLHQRPALYIVYAEGQTKPKAYAYRPRLSAQRLGYGEAYHGFRQRHVRYHAVPHRVAYGYLPRGAAQHLHGSVAQLEYLPFAACGHRHGAGLPQHYSSAPYGCKGVHSSKIQRYRLAEYIPQKFYSKHRNTSV